MRRYILLPIFLLIIVLGISCAGSRITPREHYQSVEMHPVDAIIVPGAPYNGARLDSILKGRIVWAYILWKNGLAKNVIFSGSAVYTPFIEAKVMGAYAQEMGIPAAHIYYDTLAEHSTENVYYSYLLAKQLGFKSIGLATDPVQSFTLNAYLKRRFGSPIRQLPFLIDSIAKYNHKDITIAIKPLIIRDWEGIKERETFWKRWKGTLGRNIPWHIYPHGRVPEL